MTTQMVETFRARREVNLGWCKRQVGDFIHEYTDDNEIDPRARERLIRMGYIERRTISQAELDAWREKWERENASAEVPEAEEGESFEEETPDSVKAEQEEALVNPAVEEPIEDLGPVEKTQPAKKVVRSRSRRRSNG